MNTPEGRCGTPPATGSPDRLDKATLKVHLPNGGFNVVKFGDAIDVKVKSLADVSQVLSYAPVSCCEHLPSLPHNSFSHYLYCLLNIINTKQYNLWGCNFFSHLEYKLVQINFIMFGDNGWFYFLLQNYNTVFFFTSLHYKK
jgi:hypothetical protein